jgi:short-subunit dehydrogenase
VARELKERVAAITGASSGIGAETAVACGARGMRVALFARREERLENVAERVRAAGGEAEVVAGDVRDRSALAGLVTRATRRWGRLDAIVANAGFGVAAPVAETPPEEAREIFEVNVLGTLWAIQAAWPVFEAQRRGHVVIVSSGAAFHGIPVNALYSATKAAQANLAEGLRIEAGSIGVDVSVVYPVVTETEFHLHVRDHTEGRKRQAGTKVGGPRQTAAQVAEAIVAGLARPRPEIYPYRPARILPWLEALSPSFLARILRYPEFYRRQVARQELTPVQTKL